MDWQKLYLSFDGRVNRQPFWNGNLVLVIFSLVVSGIGAMLGEKAAVILSLLASLAIIYPSICIAIKRFHDRDKSGWWVLILLVPAIGAIWYIVETGFLRGTQGENRFGPDPLAG
jgi:uncharacterized membrane protein YhaH (DUF805 family)